MGVKVKMTKAKWILRTIYQFLVALAVVTVLMYISGSANANEAIQKHKNFTNQFKTFKYIRTNIPNLENHTATSLDGFQSPLASNNYQLINIWATWCAPCVKELPTLQALAENLKGHSIMVKAVSVDFDTNPDRLTKFMAKNNLPITSIYYDPAGTFRSWADKNEFTSRGLPATILVRPNGEIQFFMLGEIDWSTTQASEFLKFVVSNQP